jgi:outer membrane lipoprotein-sorting protein
MQTGRLALALSGAVAVALVAIVAVKLCNPTPLSAPGALPPVSADQLIASISQANPGALAGTVELDSRLGLPGLTRSGGGVQTARLWSDDHGRRRMSLPEPDGERTLVDDGTNVWFWNSATRSVIRTPSAPPGSRPPQLTAMPDVAELSGLPTLPAMGDNPFREAQYGASGPHDGGMMGSPVDVAGAVLAMLRLDSTMRVDPSAMVADRAAYQLVLDPVPTERTLLREVRVAVDGQTRLPLEVSVLANGSTEPVLRIGFSTISFGAQDPALFVFTPAPGVKVQPMVPRPTGPVQAGERVTVPGGAGPSETWPTAAALDPTDPSAVGPSSLGSTGVGPTGVDVQDQDGSALIGRGWDTVLLSRVSPATRLTGFAQRPAAGYYQLHTGAADLLRRISSPISGPWGQGRLVSTPIGNTVITTDGRMATGAVPAQVLTEALTR